MTRFGTKCSFANRMGAAAIAAVLSFFLAAGLAGAHAAELVMVETKGCPWCILWNREIGPAYPHTPQGKRAPLKRVDLSAVSSLGHSLAEAVRATPTFILIDDGREVGRITGYPGADFFWGMLDQLIEKLPKEHGCDATSCPRQTLPWYKPSPSTNEGRA